MKIKALTSFSGVLTMSKGEVTEYDGEAVLRDLLKAGYVKKVSVVKNNAGKRNKDKPSV
jgi:hypothetical protein